MIAIDKDQPPPVGKVLDTLSFRLPRGFYTSLTVMNPGSHVVVTGRALLHLLPAPPDTEESGTAKTGPASDASGISSEIRVPTAACVSETLSTFLVISECELRSAAALPPPMHSHSCLTPSTSLYPPHSTQVASCGTIRGRALFTSRFKT